MAQAVRGVRGATTASDNTPEAVVEATKELLAALLDANGIDRENIASVIFTTSPDLNAAFPAEAARQLGLHDVPLLGAAEVDVPGALPRCIRVLLHMNTTKAQRDVHHVYLRDARQLRPDLAGTAADGPPRPRPEAKRIAPYEPGMSLGKARQKFRFQGSFVKLASNENGFGPSPKAVAAARQAAAEAARYPDNSCRRLRDELSRRWRLPPRFFIVGNGSDSLIRLIGEAYLQPGDEVVTADPTFGQYGFYAALAGARIVKVPVDAAWRHDLNRMADAIGPRTKVIYICNPNNPTGTIVTEKQFAAFMDRVPSRVLVVVDEAYGEYAQNTFGREWVERAERHVVVLRTFSKIYGLAGMRIGYGMAKPEIIDALRRVQGPFQVNGVAQAAAAAALADEDFVEESRRKNEAGRRYFYDRLAALGMFYVPSEANFVFVRTGRDSRDLCGRLLQHGVIVRGGDAFGQPEWLRITIGTEEENERLFDALAQTASKTASLAP